VEIMFAKQGKFLLMTLSAGILSGCEDLGTVANGMAAFSQGYSTGYTQSEALIQSQTPQSSTRTYILNGQVVTCNSFGTVTNCY